MNDAGIYSAVDRIQTLLEKYYQLSIGLRARDFILDTPNQLAKQSNHPELFSRGCLLFQYSPPDNLEIGLSFGNCIIEIMEQELPLNHTNENNLDCLWVVAEEVSHFVFLVQRSNQGGSTSHVELEWQAELDKIIVSALLLQEQTDQCYLRPLIYKSLRETKIFSDKSCYMEADRYAGKFWDQLLAVGLGRDFGIDDSRVHNLLIDNYRRSISDKFPFSNCLPKSLKK